MRSVNGWGPKRSTHHQGDVHCTPRMDDVFGDALMVEASDLFSEVEIFQERWAALHFGL